MEVTEVMRKQSRTIEKFEQVLNAAIKAHQLSEIRYDRAGDWRHGIEENHIVSALIAVRNECFY